MAQDPRLTTAAWTPCPLDRDEAGGGKRLPESRARVGRGHLPGSRAATAPSGLVIAPLPLETLAALLLVLLVFGILVLILADRPGGGRRRGLPDPFEVIVNGDRESNRDR